MIKSSQRTIHAMALELYRSINKEYVILSNTTLNEKFKIDETEKLPENTYPLINYYGIGIGGEESIEGIEGYSFSRKRAITGNMFNQIPFVMRELDNDLLDDEKSNYRFRKLEDHNGKTYACYYLKKIRKYELRDEFFVIKNEDGVSKLNLFDNNTTELLDAIPINKDNILDNLTKAEYITKLIKMDFTLTSKEVYDVKEVMNILNLPNEKISEIAICQGHDIPYSGYNEHKAYAVQIAYHLTVSINLQTDLSINKELLKQIEIGGSEPLII